MQQAVDAVAQLALIAAGFQVNVAGTLFDSVLQQPVDDVHDVRVVGAGFGLALAQFQQLLEFAQAGGLLVLRAFYRLGEVLERLPCLADLQRAGQHPANRPAQAAGQVGLPVVLVGLGTGDGNAEGVGCDDEDAVALGEGRCDQAADLGQVELHGVDAQVRLADLAGQPLAKVLKVQLLARLLAVFQAAGGDLFERMASGVGGGVVEHVLGVVGVQVLVGDQGGEHAFKVEGHCVGAMHAGRPCLIGNVPIRLAGRGAGITGEGFRGFTRTV